MTARWQRPGYRAAFPGRTVADLANRIGPGALVMVVGPSGGGKDTLISGAKDIFSDAPTVHFPRRLITRIADQQAEDHDTLTEQEFADCLKTGQFALHWSAHGLSYGISSEIDRKLHDGVCVVFNGSRSVIAKASQKYFLVVVEVTAPIDVLAERLVSRGREPREDILRRLKRADRTIPADINRITINNTHSAVVGVRELADAIRSVAG